jgi:hypothetical protein
MGRHLALAGELLEVTGREPKEGRDLLGLDKRLDRIGLNSDRGRTFRHWVDAPLTDPKVGFLSRAGLTRQR